MTLHATNSLAVSLAFSEMSPDFVARSLVERHQKRRFVVVALHKHPIAEEHRRTAGAPPRLHRVRAQVFCPEPLPLEVVAVDSGHAEIGNHDLAISRGGLGC